MKLSEHVTSLISQLIDLKISDVINPPNHESIGNALAISEIKTELIKRLDEFESNEVL